MVHRTRFVIAPGGMFLVPKGTFLLLTQATRTISAMSRSARRASFSPRPAIYPRRSRMWCMKDAQRLRMARSMCILSRPPRRSQHRPSRPGTTRPVPSPPTRTMWMHRVIMTIRGLCSTLCIFFTKKAGPPTVCTVALARCLGRFCRAYVVHSILQSRSQRQASRRAGRFRVVRLR